MIQIPSDLIDQNYSYYFNQEDILIVTNNNCTQTQCDCILVHEGVPSEVKQCEIDQDLYQIDYNNITDKPVGLTAIVIIIIGILFAILMSNLS